MKLRKEKVRKLLINSGGNIKDIDKKMAEFYDYAIRIYEDAPNRKIAEIIVTLN